MRRDDGFDAWFEGGALVRPDGSPMVFFHGTDCDEPFNVFCRCDESSVGYHFGDLAAAQARLDMIFDMDPPDERGGALIPVYCNALSPLLLEDHRCWDLRNVCNELEDKGIINDEQAEAILEGCSEKALFAAMELSGYDCVLYANQVEHGGAPALSLIVWRPDQIKSVYSSVFVQGDPRLCPAFPASDLDMLMHGENEREIDEWRDVLAAMANVPAADAPRPLTLSV